VSRNTVKTHCESIYRKLNVNSRSEAVESARDVGLLTDTEVTDVR
jgi:DNA-binding CsgD family transcriptional regulator